MTGTPLADQAWRLSVNVPGEELHRDFHMSALTFTALHTECGFDGEFDAEVRQMFGFTIVVNSSLALGEITLERKTS